MITRLKFKPLITLTTQVSKAIIQVGDLPKMPEKSMSLEDFEKLRQIVLQDFSLQKELREIAEREMFISRIVEIGSERGLHFGEKEVSEALRENRRVWIERWI